MAPAPLRGIFPPLPTPFDGAGNLQLDPLAASLADYRELQVAGLVVLGSTGEAIYLSREEKLAVLECAAHNVASGLLLIAGTGEESLRATCEMTRSAAELGYHAALVRTPHYYKGAMSAAALERFYTELADQSSIPILLYNFPQLTGVDLSVDSILRLARHPKIIGIKDSSGNLEKLVRTLAGCEEEQLAFDFLVGNAATFLPALSVGASGGILALAVLFPEACCRLQAAVAAADNSRAMQLQYALLPITALLATGGVAAIKAALRLLRRPTGWPRAPMLPYPENDVNRLAQVLVQTREALAAIS